jgi:hypothetical protein
LLYLLLRIRLGRVRLVRRWRGGSRRRRRARELTSISLRRLLVLLLRRVLAMVLLSLELLILRGVWSCLRRRISALLLVWALGRLIRARSALRRVLLLLLLRSKLARSRLLLVLRNSLALLGLRLSHGLGFWDLGLHLIVVAGSGQSWSIDGKAAFLASTEEHDQGPDESHNEEDPDQGTQACNGSEHGQASLKKNNILAITLEDVAGLAICETSIIVAAISVDWDDILGASSSGGRPSCEPENNHKAIKTDNSDDMVCVSKARDLFGDDYVGYDNPCDDCNSDREGLLRKRSIMHKPSTETEDDKREEELKSADYHDPEGSLKNMVRRRLLMMLFHFVARKGLVAYANWV